MRHLGGVEAVVGRSLRVILNGGKASGKRLEIAVEAVRRRGHAIDVRVTSQAAGAATLARQAVEDRVDVVVAGGGDGTVNEVVNGLFAASAEPDVTMAVLPLGTANDFARSCGIPPRNSSDALLLAACTEPTEIDVGCVNQRYFLNAVIAGFGAEATFRTSELMKRWLGGAAYGVAGMLSAFRSAAYPVQVRTSDGVEEAPVSFVAVMNGRWAGGARIATKAMLSDGKLDLLSVPACSMVNLPALLADIRGMPYRDPTFVRYEQREWVEIEALGELPISPDGERFCGSNLRISILKRRLPFALPPTALV
jgi:YegS/Rv2252/BmrU family lipid kinase